MERAAWLKQMREKAEALYDHGSVKYWVEWGLSANQMHRDYLQKFLERVPPDSTLLSAACGAGKYDGMLLEAGHRVVGIDQSSGMLARAREHFPAVQYEKIGLQEMDFRESFEGAICIDAMEHICPEDWPVILRGFREVLKPAGVLYFTFCSLELADAGELEGAYERAKELGLPVVFGEVADQVDEAYARAMGMAPLEIPGELGEVAVYHFNPSLAQVQAWVEQTGLAIEEQGTGNEYEHFVVRKI